MGNDDIPDDALGDGVENAFVKNLRVSPQCTALMLWTARRRRNACPRKRQRRRPIPHTRSSAEISIREAHSRYCGPAWTETLHLESDVAHTKTPNLGSDYNSTKLGYEAIGNHLEQHLSVHHASCHT